jgi:2-octaprenyl-6-methoxyphenol hydroxylase
MDMHVSFLSTGEQIKSSLIIGCDGKNSVTASFANINKFGWNYNQTSLVCAIDHEKPHNSCAYQLFKPSGPIAILPLPGNRSSIVWTEDNKAAAFISQLNKKDYLKNLNSKINLDLGEVSLSGKQFSYPLTLSLRENFISNRVALVGDSAHGIHPLAGQGLNLGLRDVASIGEIIINATRRGEDIGSLGSVKAV